MAPKVKNVADRIPKNVLIDQEDFKLASKYSWRICKTSGYVVATTKEDKTIRIHRLILNPKKKNYIDHINHNKLDNRRINLRECTPSFNSCNRRKGCNNKSGYKGVYKQVGENHAKPWRASIGLKGVRFYLGDYKTPREAAISYNTAALKLHGDYASLNQI